MVLRQTPLPPVLQSLIELRLIMKQIASIILFLQLLLLSELFSQNPTSRHPDQHLIVRLHLFHKLPRICDLLHDFNHLPKLPLLGQKHRFIVLSGDFKVLVLGELEVGKVVDLESVGVEDAFGGIARGGGEAKTGERGGVLGEVEAGEGGGLGGEGGLELGEFLEECVES